MEPQSALKLLYVLYYNIKTFLSQTKEFYKFGLH